MIVRTGYMAVFCRELMIINEMSKDERIQKILESWRGAQRLKGIFYGEYK